VLADQNHALRHEFDRFVIGFIETLRDSPDYAVRAEKLKQDLLSRPELSSLADDIWQSLRDFVEQDLESEGSRTRGHLAALFVDAGRQLAADPHVRADMNDGFVVALSSFVDSQKSSVSTFIADQVKRWDLVQLTRLIELNIGRDLQYIRFNGMLIGGLAGLLLHSIELLFFAN
jgi:uncharacterized membrane-anchored protein YjiN (DUF445 family)